MVNSEQGSGTGTEVALIANATVHGRTGLWDLYLSDARVAAIEPHDPSRLERAGSLDAEGNLVSRAFAEPHFHPDKSYSLSELPEGVDAEELAGLDGFARAARIKNAFTIDNVENRARRAFELAARNGVTRMRATADVDSLIGLNGIEGLLHARESVRSLIDVELVAFPQEGLHRDQGAESLLRESLGMGVEFIGGWPNVESTREQEIDHLRKVFDLAEEFNVGVDVHADCFLDPHERILEVVADETIRRGMRGRVLASHCTALEVYDDDEATRVIEKVARAGIDVAVIPSNLAGVGPRGLSRPQELRAAGVNVMAGSDNMNDGWYPLGTLNPIDRANMAFLGGSFHSEADVDVVWDMISGSAWRALGKAAGDLEIGSDAEIVVLGVQTRTQVLRRPLGPITTIHRGRVTSRRVISESFDVTPGQAHS